jgi:deoxyribodipyrimidine photo-lyase
LGGLKKYSNDLDMNFNTKRVRKLNDFKSSNKDVVYWMSRDQRAFDNWALVFAASLAKQNDSRLAVIFCLDKEFPDSNLRHFDFLLKGLKEVRDDLKDLGIEFYFIQENPEKGVVDFLTKNKVENLVTDFSPLKIKQKWTKDVLDFCNQNEISYFEVDAHNVVPVWAASDKEEYAARTIRSKINSKLDEFLTDFPDIAKITKDLKGYNSKDFKSDFEVQEILDSIKNLDKTVKSVDWILPGAKEANKNLKKFIEKRLGGYDELRNDPNQEYESDLSPYFHFGQISSQRVAFEVKKYASQKDEPSLAESYLEELIVRKELADNFCFYNSNYDNVNSFKDWAKKTLDEHANDKREYLYSFEEFEQARTHDELWNAAQLQMVNLGKMHGFMRMYWAKKILEWTQNYTQAFDFATKLNDKYSLDGRDPNGFTGVAWSIGGIHDRAWFEREVFGKIRYMNYNGCKRKFDVGAYIKRQLQSKNMIM